MHNPIFFGGLLTTYLAFNVIAAPTPSRLELNRIGGKEARNTAAKRYQNAPLAMPPIRVPGPKSMMNEEKRYQAAEALNLMRSSFVEPVKQSELNENQLIFNDDHGILKRGQDGSSDCLTDNSVENKRTLPSLSQLTHMDNVLRGQFVDAINVAEIPSMSVLTIILNQVSGEMTNKTKPLAQIVNYIGALASGNLPSSIPIPQLYNSGSVFNLSDPNSLGIILTPVAHILESISNTMQGMRNALQMFSLNLSHSLSVTSPVFSSNSKRQYASVSSKCDFTAVNAAVNNVIGSFQGFISTINAFNSVLKQIPALAVLSGMLDNIQSEVGDLIELTQNTMTDVENLTSKFLSICQDSQDPLTNLEEVLQDTFSALSNLYSGITNILSAVANATNPIDTANNTVTNLIPSIVNSTNLPLNPSSGTLDLSNVSSTLVNATTALTNASTVLSNATTTLGNATDAIGKLTSSITNATTTIQNATSTLGGVIDTVGQLGSIQNLTSVLNNATQSLGNVTGTLGQVTSALSNVTCPNNITGPVNGAVNGVSSTLSGTTGSLGNLTGVISNGTSSLGAVISNTSSLSNTTDQITSLTNITGTLANVTSNLSNVTSMLSNLTNQTTGLVQNATSGGNVLNSTGNIVSGIPLVTAPIGGLVSGAGQTVSVVPLVGGLAGSLTSNATNTASNLSSLTNVLGGVAGSTSQLSGAVQPVTGVTSSVGNIIGDTSAAAHSGLLGGTNAAAGVPKILRNGE